MPTESVLVAASCEQPTDAEAAVKELGTAGSASADISLLSADKGDPLLIVHSTTEEAEHVRQTLDAHHPRMEEGGPANATQVLATYIFQKGFVENQMHYASTISVVLLVLALLFAGIQLWVTHGDFSIGGGRQDA